MKHLTFDNLHIIKRKLTKIDKVKISQLSIVSCQLFKPGQSLIEVLIAFAVAVLIGVGLVTASLATQRSSVSARNESAATKLTQEYLEQIRVIRDVKGIDSIGSFTNGTCKKITDSDESDPSEWDSTGTCTAVTYPYNDWDVIPLENTYFYRKLAISDFVSGTSKKIVVTVAWREGNNDRTSTAETVLSKWFEGEISP